MLQIDTGLTVLSTAGISGNIAIIFFGCVLGYIRDLNIKRREELTRLKRAENKLKEYRDKLESMVKEKTAELSENVVQLEIQEQERIRLTKAIEPAMPCVRKVVLLKLYWRGKSGLKMKGWINIFL